MCWNGRTDDVPIALPGDYPREHQIIVLKEQTENGIFATFIFSSEPIGISEPYHQIGPDEKGQLVMRQSLYEAFLTPSYRGGDLSMSGYLIGRKTETGIIIDGAVFVQDNHPEIIRLNEDTAPEGVVNQRLSVLNGTQGEMSIVGTFSSAQYADRVLTEYGVSVKKAGMPHLYLIYRDGVSYNEVAITNWMQDNHQLHQGIKIVEHGGLALVGLQNEILSIEQPSINIVLL